MLRSASSLLILSLLFLQVAIAQFTGDGVYKIQNFDGLFLGFETLNGLPEVPVRLYEEDSHYVVKWLVKKGVDGGFTISAGKGHEDDYKIVIHQYNYVFASMFKNPESWAVTSVGDRKFEIKIPNEDKVFTSAYGPVPVTLERSIGEENQKWYFIPIDSNDNYHRGSRNHLCKQEQW